MSKSLGNSPDPLELIGQYGADAIRTGMLFSSPAGNDLLYDEKLIEQGRNFANKIWNAFRLVKGWEVEEKTQPVENALAFEWFTSDLNRALQELEDHFAKFRMSDALMVLYKLIWSDFCSWYLEWIKPPYGEKIDSKSQHQSLELFDKLLRVLHPFMPFLSEELWQNIKDQKGQFLMKDDWVASSHYDEEKLKEVALLFDIVTNVRNIRNSKQLSPKEKLPLIINDDTETFGNLTASVIKLANLSEVSFSSEKPENCYNFVIQSTEFYLKSNTSVDIASEKTNIEKEIAYNKGFLNSVNKKLGNEKFMAGAPEKVVQMELKKKADAEAKIHALMENLAKLEG